jgi:hypothetical protein
VRQRRFSNRGDEIIWLYLASKIDNMVNGPLCVRCHAKVSRTVCSVETKYG